VVPPEHAGVRIDKVLRDLASGPSRSYLKKLLVSGFVRVNGTPVPPRYAVSPGEEVMVELAGGRAVQLLENPPALRVLFEDDYILVIDKPAGMAAHPSHNEKGGTVAQAAQHHCGGNLPKLAGADRPGIVHRLDRETSGVMVLAKVDEAFHFLQAQFKNRTTAKEYRAIVYGVPRFDSDHVDRAIARDPFHPERMRVVREAGKEAVTYYEVVQKFDGFAHVRCVPKTGRTHQIRLHMMSIGHSIVGDRVYRSRNTGGRSLPPGAPAPDRHCLHARSLAIAHPRTHERMTFESEIPADMRSLLEWLGNLPA
jgi:23S rRNA pseudouridine1911/1915/1917 synthase